MTLSHIRVGQYIQYAAYAVAIAYAFTYACGLIAGSYIHKMNDFISKR